jgi:hypothetical protein
VIGSVRSILGTLFPLRTLVVNVAPLAKGEDYPAAVPSKTYFHAVPFFSRIRLYIDLSLWFYVGNKKMVPDSKTIFLSFSS